MSSGVEQTVSIEKHRQAAYRRVERAGVWLGAMVVSASLVAGNLSPSAKGEMGSLRVKESPRVASKGGVIEIEKQPFFPIMSWAQSPAEVEDNLSIGINAFMGADGNQRRLASEIDGRAYVIPRYIDAEQEKQHYFGEIGWHLPDEADGYGILPSELPRTRRVQETGKLIFQTLTYHYSSREAKIQRADGRIIDNDDYRDYINNADVVGTDLYPMAHSCDHLTASDVYHYQKELEGMTDDKPTYQWIEVNQVGGDCGDDPVTPAITRAESYLAVAGGADGLGYFTYGWEKSKMDRFDVKPEMHKALKNLSDEIEALTPMLLAPELPFVSGRKDPIKIGGRSYRGEYYMIAVNSSDDLVDWRRKLSSTDLGNQRIAVYGETRVVRAKNGWISDTLEPYQVRIYHWKPLND